MTFLVIGLDGAAWSAIKPNLAALPSFRELLARHRHSTLECDVRPVHSGPSWTTIFTGLKPDEHGVKHFVVEEKQRKALLARKLFIWDRVEAAGGRAIAMCIPIAIPPLNRNYELRGWERVMLATSEDEMFSGTARLLDDTVAAIEYGGADLIAVVFPEPDRAQHMFWHDKGRVLAHYQSVDRALRRLMPYLMKGGFLILSDHGFTDAEETRRNGWDTVRGNQTGGHHPDGIAISDAEPPQKVSEVFSFVSRRLEPHPV
jgi:hypothetical protein